MPWGATLPAKRTLVVDAANVIGSRADGWWRDRAAAARRLCAELADARLPFDEVLLVLEGAARTALPAGGDRVVVRHAEGSGDDTVVELVGRRVRAGAVVTVATADRELRRRAEALGASSRGPRWLLDQL